MERPADAGRWWSTRDERREERRRRHGERRAARDASGADRASMTVERIAHAALRIVDTEGLEALTLRRLAAELGVGATTIYWYVRDKHELLDLVRDQMVADVVSIPGGGGWRAQAEAFAHGLRAVLLRHANAAAIWGMRPALGPNAIEVMERLLAAFVEAGLPDDDAADACVVLMNYIIGSASWQNAQARPDDPVRVEQLARARDYVADMPPDRLPNLRRVGARILRGDPDPRFHLGLAALLDGFAARARSTSGS